MAHGEQLARGQQQIRTVPVRLRRVARILATRTQPRRVLAIAGIAAAGWLLGSATADQAHAETHPGAAQRTPASAAAHSAPGRLVTVRTDQAVTLSQGTTAATRTSASAKQHAQPGRGLPAEASAEASPQMQPTVAISTTVAPRGATATVETANVLPAAPRRVTVDIPRSLCGAQEAAQQSTQQALPGSPEVVDDVDTSAYELQQFVTELTAYATGTGWTGLGGFWTPPHHHAADATSHDRADEREPAPLTGPSAGPYERHQITGTAATALKAPIGPRDLPTPATPQAGGFPSGGGSSALSGVLDHLAQAGLLLPPPSLRTPIPGAVAEATRAAAREPSVSPD